MVTTFQRHTPVICGKFLSLGDFHLIGNCISEKNPLELFLFTDEPLWDLNHDHLALQPFSSMVAAAALSKTFTDLKRALRSIA